MVIEFYIPKYVREYRLLSKTVIWLQKQPSAEEAIDKLVANVAETEAKNPPIATRNVKSVAEEQLEICYEQIEALKQLLKYQMQVSENYRQEIKHCNQEIQECNQEMAKFEKELFSRDKTELLSHY